MKIILGIDPGSRITGYGVLFQKGLKINYLDSGCIHTNKNNFFNRLRMIYEAIDAIIVKFQPNYLAIEKIFSAKNVYSALKLAEARGVAIIAAANLSIPIFEYGNKQIKQIITGNGSAKKSQVQQMIKTLLKLSTKKLKEDASDALAIAMTHYFIYLKQKIFV